MKKNIGILIIAGVLFFIVVVIISKSISENIESKQDKEIIRAINERRAITGEKQI